jgi:hypothetical protein
MPVDLPAVVADLTARVAELERVRGVGDADRVLSLEEVAARIGRSPETIKRHWLRSFASQRMHRIELLLFRDVSGRWVSTPRKVQQWTDAIASGALSSLRGGRLSISRDDIAPTVSRPEMAKGFSSRFNGQAPSASGANRAGK